MLNKLNKKEIKILRIEIIVYPLVDVKLNLNLKNHTDGITKAKIGLILAWDKNLCRVTKAKKCLKNIKMHGAKSKFQLI
jgi:hypothetical protein